MNARDALRTLWAEGVRVNRRDDGSLALAPAARVTPDLLTLANTAKPEIARLVAALPAPGRCPICGARTGWRHQTQIHCVACARLAAHRLLAESKDISPKGAKRAA